MGYDAFREKIISRVTTEVVHVVTPIIYDPIIEEMDRMNLKILK